MSIFDHIIVIFEQIFSTLFISIEFVDFHLLLSILITQKRMMNSIGNSDFKMPLSIFRLKIFI